MRALVKVTPKRPLIIRQMKGCDFKDYQEAARKLKYSVVPYTKLKHAIYRKGDDRKILYRTSFEEELHEAELNMVEAQSALATRSTGRKRPKTSGAGPTEDRWPLPRPLDTKPKISADKKRDIMSMLKYMPTVDSEFMTSILQ